MANGVAVAVFLMGFEVTGSTWPEVAFELAEALGAVELLPPQALSSPAAATTRAARLTLSRRLLVAGRRWDRWVVMVAPLGGGR
jgi:hypothetical protein